jgi:glycerol uptake facilitator-like aquaporin
MTAEACGTAMLVIAVIGSGIMGERLAGGNVAVALLANALATGGALLALILALAPVSGAHLNPAVTVSEAARGALPWRDVPGYLVAQLLGAFGGVALTHAMFGLPLFTPSSHARTGVGQVLSEAVATFGLLCVIRGTGRAWPRAVSFAVAAYITGAYWFTASTAFANPAVTLARAATDTFSGIRPSDVPGFLLGQLLGAIAAAALLRWLFPVLTPAARQSSPRTTEELSP